MAESDRGLAVGAVGDNGQSAGSSAAKVERFESIVLRYHEPCCESLSALTRLMHRVIRRAAVGGIAPTGAAMVGQGCSASSTAMQ